MFRPTAVSPRRQALVAVVMLAVLLGSVGAAWWLVHHTAAPHRTGEEILRELRREGLGAYWSGIREQWYLRHVDGRPRGWRLVLRAPAEGGGFHGLHVFGHQAPAGQGRIIKWEKWRLNADATEGEFTAGDVVTGRTTHLAGTDTEIRLSGGMIEAKQVIDGILLDSTVAAPGNYAPEGTLSLLHRLVADRRTEAAFRLVFNEEEPVGRETYLATAVMRYDGTAQVDGKEARRVRVRASGRRVAEEAAYYLDAEGNVLSVIVEGFREAPASAEEVSALFPDAVETVRQLIRASGWRFAPDAGPEGDSQPAVAAQAQPG